MKITAVIADVQFILDIPVAFIPTVNNYLTLFTESNPHRFCASFIVVPTDEHLSGTADPAKYFEEERGAFCYRSGKFELKISLEERQAILLVSLQQRDLGAILLSAFKWFFVFMIIKNGGVPLHSSLVAYLGKGYLFAAPSEMGKSTIAKLLSRNLDSVIRGSDELNIVYNSHSGLTVCSTPFCSSNGSGALTRGVTLSNVFFLGHSSSHRLEYLTAAGAFRMLLQNVYHVAGNLQISNRLMDSIAVLSQMSVYYRLYFKDDPSIAQFFQQQLEAMYVC